MKRVIVPILALVLMVACGRKSSESAGAVPEAGQAPATQAAAPAARPAEPAKVEITEDLIKKYMEYEKENLKLVAQFAAETRKNIEAARGDTVKTINQIAINDKLSKELDAKLLAARRSMGLGEEAFNVVKEAAEEVGTARLLYNQMGGDAQLARMEAEQKEQVEKAPAEQREAAAAASSAMLKSIRDLRDGTDLRKKYGDAATEILLKYADALAGQRADALKVMAGQK